MKTMMTLKVVRQNTLQRQHSATYDHDPNINLVDEEIYRRQNTEILVKNAIEDTIMRELEEGSRAVS